MAELSSQEVLELLQFAQKRAKLNIDNEKAVADLVDEMKKSKVIEQHPFKISEMQKHGEPYFITYVTDETKPKNRRQISAKSRQLLENKIFEAYKQAEAKNIITFADVYLKFMQTEKVLTVENSTMQRYHNDYLKYYEKSDFAKRDITKITTHEVKLFYLKSIKGNNLTSHSFANMRSIAKQVFSYAVETDIIKSNPALDVTIASSAFTKTKKKKQAEVYNYTDKEIIENYIMANEHKNTVPYGAVLNFQLGLRVGELVALKWSDISDDTVDISRMEKVYRPLDIKTMQKLPTVHEIVEYTKTDAGCRTILLTDKAKKALQAIKRFNAEHGIHSEWVISNETGRRIYKETVNDTLYSLCDKANLLRRSNHKIRKTTLTAWLDAGINADKVCEMAGHEDIETTLKYYNRNRDDNSTVLLKMASNL